MFIHYLPTGLDDYGYILKITHVKLIYTKLILYYYDYLKII